jgi:hypothetical protein
MGIDPARHLRRRLIVEIVSLVVVLELYRGLGMSRPTSKHGKYVQYGSWVFLTAACRESLPSRAQRFAFWLAVVPEGQCS